jgi:ABC-type transport system involved in multi-copper enzyme maturation permease subunit
MTRMAISSEPTTAPVVPRPTPVAPSLWRAWIYLVVLSWRRQLRMRQTVWIAGALLLFTATFVSIMTASNRWGMRHWWYRFRTNEGEPRLYRTYNDIANESQWLLLATPRPVGLSNVEHALTAGVQVILDEAPFRNFTNVLVLTVLLPFLLPLWSLSFATESIGGDREANNLVWLLTRPLPRPAVFLGKYLALLPWTLCLNVGGFALLCLLSGWQGRQALQMYWPAVVAATFAFTALFFLMGAWFRRSAVIAIVYAFFFEPILGSMPGYFKRVSLTFYVKCMVFQEGGARGIRPDNPDVFLAVGGGTALAVLLTLTVVFLALGTYIFSRSQYQDVV